MNCPKRNNTPGGASFGCWCDLGQWYPIRVLTPSGHGDLYAKCKSDVSDYKSYSGKDCFFGRGIDRWTWWFHYSPPKPLSLTDITPLQNLKQNITKSIKLKNTCKMDKKRPVVKYQVTSLYTKYKVYNFSEKFMLWFLRTCPDKSMSTGRRKWWFLYISPPPNPFAEGNTNILFTWIKIFQEIEYSKVYCSEIILNFINGRKSLNNIKLLHKWNILCLDWSELCYKHII